MDIISLKYAILVVVTFFIYWIFPKKNRWVALMISSVVFVLLSNIPSLAIFMYAMIILTWIATRLLEKEQNIKARRLILFLALFIDAALFYGLRIVNAVLDIVQKMTGDYLKLSVLLPVGISYFSLSIMSYLLDCYWGTQKSEENVFKFITFGSYFPLLTSGPIVRYKETGANLFEEKSYDGNRVKKGLIRILFGLFKKLVISERVAVLVNTIYGDFTTYYGMYVIVAGLLFFLQLYTDFSGCIDIIAGVSELFAVDLPENFDLPFTSKTVAEFWRRWHITLGGWLKDYVLYPVLKTQPFQKMSEKFREIFGKKKGKKIAVWPGIFISWFLIGCWHGGGWNYIIGVGLFYWFIIVMSEALEPTFKKITDFLHINTKAWGYVLFQRIRTYILVAIGLSMFRANEGIHQCIEMFRAAFAGVNPSILTDGSLLALGLDGKDMSVLVIAVLIMGGLGIVRMHLGKTLRQWLVEKGDFVYGLVLILAIMTIVIFGMYGGQFNASDFIYKGF